MTESSARAPPGRARAGRRRAVSERAPRFVPPAAAGPWGASPGVRAARVFSGPLRTVGWAPRSPLWESSEAGAWGCATRSPRGGDSGSAPGLRPLREDSGCLAQVGAPARRGEVRAGAGRDPRDTVRGAVQPALARVLLCLLGFTGCLCGGPVSRATAFAKFWVNRFQRDLRPPRGGGALPLRVGI